MVMENRAQATAQANVDHHLNFNIQMVQTMPLPMDKKQRIISALREKANNQEMLLRGLEGSPALMGAANRSTLTLYHQGDGSAREIPVAQLGQHLQEIDQDPASPNRGNLLFDIDPPDNIKPFVGTHKCFLHPDHPIQKRYRLNAQTGEDCSKATIRSAYEVFSHMDVYHTRVWALLKKTVPGIEEASLEPIGEEAASVPVQVAADPPTDFADFIGAGEPDKGKKK